MEKYKQEVDAFFQEALDKGLSGLNYFSKQDPEVQDGNMKAGWHAWDNDDTHIRGQATASAAVIKLIQLKALERDK